MNIFKKLKNYFTFTDSQAMNQEDTKEEQKEEQKEYIFCPECNAMNSDYRTHCIRCGHYLKDTSDLNTQNYKNDCDTGSRIIQEDLDSLDEDKKRLLLEVNKYITDDVNNGYFDTTFINKTIKHNNVEQNIKYSFDDTIIDHLCLPENFKGYKACGFNFNLAKKNITSILPFMYHDSHLINIFSLALTTYSNPNIDYLHFSRIAIIETIIYTTSIYTMNAFTEIKIDSKEQYFKTLFNKISLTIEYLYEFPNDLALKMLNMRFCEYNKYIKQYGFSLQMSIFSKHLQYEIINKSFSLINFRYVELDNNKSLRNRIKILTDEIEHFVYKNFYNNHL